MMAAQLSNTMSNSLKGRPVQGRIFQGKEPPQFIALFQLMIVLKGGLSSGYKMFLEEKGLNDETYNADGVALVQVSGASVHNNKAVQVDAVATSLSSTDCFVLQSGSSIFTWHGNSSTFEQQQLAAKIAEFLKPGVALKHAKEGTESSAFWFALGGKQSYTSKKSTQETVRDPHLYTFSFNKGKFEVSEVFNFSQDDLLTEDMLILDTHAEVFIWVGQSVEPKEKQKAFEFGQNYIKLAATVEGLSPDVPLYKVTEGNEPCFFTTYFSWDSSKATALGNSFEKKVSLLFGTAIHSSESNDRSNGGPTQRASAMAALTSAFNPSSGTKISGPKPATSAGQGSQRAAAVAALSSVLTAEQKKGDVTPPRFSRSPPAEAESKGDSTPAVEESEEISETKETAEEGGSVSESNGEDSSPKEVSPSDENGGESAIFSYERVKAKSTNPATGIDYKRREAYLSDAEFESVLGMTKDAFYQQPKWKQDMQKKKVDLF